MMKKFFKFTKMSVLCCITALSLTAPLTCRAETDFDAYRAVFDPQYYHEQNPDLHETLGDDPELLFQHFVSTGIWEGRSGIPEFNVKAYVFYNEDLVGSFKADPSGYCRHYLTMGKDEGRICTPREDASNLIGTYTTYYDPSRPRAINIALAVERINGITLQPGESFSFSNTVLPRQPEYGYVMAPAIGGQEYGGGICQVSSTLYAAACHAMFPATERHPHSSRISYLPEGLDATISEGYKDLKFVNIYQEPLIIQASVNEGSLTVSLWLKAVDEPKAQDEQNTPETQSGQLPTQKIGPGEAAPAESENQTEQESQPEAENQTDMEGQIESESQVESENQPESESQSESENQPETD